MTAKEVSQADFLSSQVSHMIDIRFPGATPLIAPGMRVQFIAITGTAYYQIQAVQNPDQRNIKLQLLCLGINTAE